MSGGSTLYAVRKWMLKNVEIKIEVRAGVFKDPPAAAGLL